MHIPTRNKTIMDYVVKYMHEKNKDPKEVALLNYMRLYKQIILPCELVGLMGTGELNRYKNDLATSCLK